MNSNQYKELSVREFTKAASIYESDHAGVYNICKKDYPDLPACETYDELLALIRAAL